MRDPVEFIEAPWEGAGRQGWDGAGWYFWEENWAYCQGPYDSEKEAKEALDRYARWLDGDGGQR